MTRFTPTDRLWLLFVAAVASAFIAPLIGGLAS